MKTILKSICFLSVLFFLTLFISNCEKEQDEETNPEEKPIELTLDNSNPLPYEVIKVTVTGAKLNKNEYEGEIGDTAFVALKTDTNQLSFMVPYMKPGNYTLSVTIGEEKPETDITLQKQSEIANYQEVITGIENGIDSAIICLENTASETGQTLSDEDKLLINNSKATFKDAMAQLSEDDKKQLAQFANVNPEIFSSVNFGSQKSTSESTLEDYHHYFMVQAIKIAASGITFGLAITTPPDLVTKTIAAASAVYLAMKLKEVGMRTWDLYGEKIVLKLSELGLLNKSVQSDFTFYNDKRHSFNIRVVNRTIYSEDKNSATGILVDIISDIGTFQTWWGKIDGYIIKFKELFGFDGGGLTGRPPEVSELSTYETSEETGKPPKAKIFNISNSNVMVTVDTLTSNLRAIFSTTETEDQNFSFEFTYSNEYFSVENTYSATLIAAGDTSSGCTVEDLDAWWEGLDNESRKVYNYILGHGAITDKPTPDEMSSFCGMTSVDIRDQGFTQFNGLEIFASLESLNCSNNELTSLDLSGCPELIYLFCDNNNLNNINVTNCENLGLLDCYNNQITSLDVSNCTVLDNLRCYNNQLTILDLSSCENLYSLVCYNNQLTDLNIYNCSSLTELRCSSNQLISLNLPSCPDLLDLRCDDNQLTSLNVSSCPSLEKLMCSYNQLTSLDVSSCSALDNLYCEYNQISSLNTSNCKSLTQLYCFNNQLTSLSLSSCESLRKLECDNNQLSSLNISGLQNFENYQVDIRYNEFGYNELENIINELDYIEFYWTCDNASDSNGPDPENPYEGSDCDKLHDL